MNTAKNPVFTLILTLCLAFACSTEAQTPRMATVNITPDSDKVRINAIGDVSEMRIEVADEAGDIVFQSGQITGNTLDWKMTDAQGERVSPGTYLVTVTFRNATGKLRKRVEQVTVAEADPSDTQSAKTATAAPEAVQAPIDGAGAATKIAKFTDANTITDSVITESAGKIGIGGTGPVSKLHIMSAANDRPPRLQSSGTTSFAAGWDFYHGTVGKGYVGVPGTDVGAPGPGEMLLYGSTGVKTSLWAGGTRAMTIATNGNVGIGTTSPFYKLHVRSEAQTAFYAESTQSGGSGVYGIGKYGVVGTGTAYGFSGTGGSAGVFGTSNNVGLWGQGGKWGVYGNGTDYGVYGDISSYGLYGNSTNYGVYGKGNIAVHGQGGTYGVVGYGTRQGVTGTGPYIGVYGESTASTGWSVYGKNLAGGYAGFFDGKVHVKGAFTYSSDRHLKANFSSVNPRTILDRLARIPIQTWNYKSEPESVRHMGVTAQDFRAAFSLGEDDKTIASVDMNGVTVAALQGLYQIVKEKDRQIAEQSRQIKELQTRLSTVERTTRQRRAGHHRRPAR